MSVDSVSEKFRNAKEQYFFGFPREKVKKYKQIFAECLRQSIHAGCLHVAFVYVRNNKKRSRFSDFVFNGLRKFVTERGLSN